MPRILARFKAEDDGAVTVDWIVLTAAIVGLGITVIASVSAGALNHADGLGAHLNAQSINDY